MARAFQKPGREIPKTPKGNSKSPVFRISYSLYIFSDFEIRWEVLRLRSKNFSRGSHGIQNPQDLKFFVGWDSPQKKPSLVSRFLVISGLRMNNCREFRLFVSNGILLLLILLREWINYLKIRKSKLTVWKKWFNLNSSQVVTLKLNSLGFSLGFVFEV